MPNLVEECTIDETCDVFQCPNCKEEVVQVSNRGLDFEYCPYCGAKLNFFYPTEYYGKYVELKPTAIEP